MCLPVRCAERLGGGAVPLSAPAPQRWHTMASPMLRLVVRRQHERERAAQGCRNVAKLSTSLLPVAKHAHIGSGLTPLEKGVEAVVEREPRVPARRRGSKAAWRLGMAPNGRPNVLFLERLYTGNALCCHGRSSVLSRGAQ